MIGDIPLLKVGVDRPKAGRFAVALHETSVGIDLDEARFARLLLVQGTQVEQGVAFIVVRDLMQMPRSERMRRRASGDAASLAAGAENGRVQSDQEKGTECDVRKK